MSARVCKTALFAICALVSLRSGPIRADTLAPHYTVVETIPLSGPTRWDYLTVESATHRLFITRGEQVDVMDVVHGTVAGSLPGTQGVHGVALASDLGKGFVSNGRANTVTVFDLTTLAPLATLPSGTKPDAIVYDPATRRVFAADGGSGDLTVLNAEESAVIKTVPLGGQPEFAAVDGTGRLYVNLEDTSQVAVVDTKELTVLAHYTLAPDCQRPTGLAIDSAQHRLFAVCGNAVMVVLDGHTGRILATLPIGGGADAAVFDPGTHRAFSANGDGTLTVVEATDADHYRVVQTLPTRVTARTLALDPATHRLYLAAAETDGFEPATGEHSHPRRHIKPGTFMILAVEESPWTSGRP